eukprot:3866213-Pyramimonas_sp.AAC.1
MVLELIAQAPVALVNDDLLETVVLEPAVLISEVLHESVLLEPVDWSRSCWSAEYCPTLWYLSQLYWTRSRLSA